MRIHRTPSNVLAVAMTCAIFAAIHPLYARLKLDDTVNRAFPRLPEQFREDIEHSVTLAPLAGRLDSAGTQCLRLIQYPYLDIDHRNGYAFHDDVERRVFSAQQLQLVTPRGTPDQVSPLTDIGLLRKESLWQLGRAMWAAEHDSAGQWEVQRLAAPPELTRNQDPNVRLFRTLFWAAYGDDALRQAVTGT
jgi:hypothetical protein